MSQVITPYLCVADALVALDGYRAFFSAAVSNVVEMDGRIGHAELEFGGAVFYLSSEAPELGLLDLGSRVEQQLRGAGGCGRRVRRPGRFRWRVA